MSNAADADVLAGFLGRFTASSAAAVIAGGFWSGRLPAADSGGKPLVMPYVFAKSERAKDPQYFSIAGDGSDSYIDSRRVTLQVYGIGEAAVGALVEQLKSTFDRKKFTIPNVLHLMACLSLGEARLEPDPTTKDGQDVWIGTVEFEVVTSRPVA